MSFVHKNGFDILLNQNEHPLYQNKCNLETIQNLFSNDSINTKNDNQTLKLFDYHEQIPLVESIPLETNLNNFLLPTLNKYLVLQNDDDLIGGKKISKVSQKIEKKKFLKVVPSYINVVKGKLLYNEMTKFSLDMFTPQSTPVIGGLIIDMYKVQQTLNKEEISLDDIHRFIEMHDVVPLLFNFDTRNIIYKNNKPSFFSLSSKLFLLTFEIKKNFQYFYENPTKENHHNFKDIKEIIDIKNYIVAHYIYETYFLFVTNPKTHLKLKHIYEINFNNKIEFLEVKDKAKIIKYVPNNKKISLSEISEAVNESLFKLTKFITN